MNRSASSFALAALLLMGLAASAQPLDKDFYHEHPSKLYGIYEISGFEGTPDTKAPKGYKPFYISHYGRHGARFQTAEEGYTYLLDLLSDAGKSGSLTDLGESVYQRLSDYYALARNRRGDLTPVGFRQHKEWAHRTYERFPEVFKDNPEITACASLVTRCIMSMEAFCLGLKEMNPELDIYAEATRVLLDEVNPGDRENPNYFDAEPSPYPWDESIEDFTARLWTKDFAVNVAERLFSEEFVANKIEERTFINSLYYLVSGMECLDCGITLDDILTEDEMFTSWKISNASFYDWTARSAQRYGPILRCIIEDADRDIKADRKAVRLRFGHDGNLLCLLTMIGAKDFAIVPKKIDSLHLTWQNWNTPMAATLEFVFYRSKKNPEILFKAVLNGEEIPLSILTPVCGPYYRWDDFKKWGECHFERPEGVK